MFSSGREKSQPKRRNFLMSFPLFLLLIVSLTIPSALFAEDTGNISGTVTLDSGGPISGIWVNAYDFSTFQWKGQGQTDTNGNYTITGLSAGSYSVFINAYGTDYVWEYYNDTLDQYSATEVQVKAAATTEDIDFSLALAGKISGYVKSDSGDHQPIPDLTVYATYYSGNYGGFSADTQADGSYLITGLPANSYRVFVYPGDTYYVQEYFENTTNYNNATSVSVAAGDNINIDFGLALGGKISGVVKDESGNGIGGISVNAWEYSSWAWGSGVQTQPDGSYTIIGLPEGSYRVYVYPGDTYYVQEYYENTTNYNSATAVFVTANTTKPGIDFSLAKNGKISGVVKDDSGNGIGGVQVVAHDFLTHNWIGQAQTKIDDGCYTITGLPAGTYRVRVYPYGTNYAMAYYENTVYYSNATAVSVAAGLTTPDINFNLATGDIIKPPTVPNVVNWSTGNLLLSRGVSGAFDERGQHRPVVIKDSDTYKMWYTGIDSGGNHSIGFSTSPDGTSWTKQGQVFVKGSSDSWDESHVGYAWIIKETGGTNPYKMWYSGTDDPAGLTNWQIGYAESLDGIAWTRNTDPLNLKGTVNDWDGGSVKGPCVIKDGSTYRMWYKGWNGAPPGSEGLGYAESPDGITWTRYDNPDSDADPFVNSDPVIQTGNPGSWDGFKFASPTVIKDGLVYRMWYDGTQADDMPSRVGYAYSSDRITWHKYDGNPVIMEGTAGSFDEDGLFDPMVLKDGNTYRMYYAGSSNCSTSCIDEIGYAESYAYSGPNPVIDKAGILALNSNGKQIVFSVTWSGPGPLDITSLYVLGPNGYFRGFTESDIRNYVGQQVVSGSSAVAEADFSAYAGLYTFTLTANNGTAASKSIFFELPTVIPCPVDGSGSGELDRRIELGGNIYAEDEVYIGGATPTFKWKPSLGPDKFYRVRVLDLKKLRIWFWSDPAPGTQVDGSGYMSATVPSGALHANTPYQYEIEVLDTGNLEAAHNRSRSDLWKFYTGTKGTDFISNPYVMLYKSFRIGDLSGIGLNLNNLAPWDISVVSPFQVTGGTYTYTFNVSSPNYPDIDYFQNWPAYYDNNSPNYFGTLSAGAYQFAISDGINSDTASLDFMVVPEVPQVTKKTMTPADNTYLQTSQPITFIWKSERTGFKYRGRIHTWKNLTVGVSPWMDGMTPGTEMSVTMPAYTLQPGPYRWFVEVQDTGNYTRTRSQYLALNIYGSNIILNPPTLSTPAGGAAGQANDVSVTWLDTNTNPQESGYMVRIKPSGGSYDYYSEAQDVTSHATSGLSTGMTYYWSVKAVGDGTSTMDSAYPADRAFTVAVPKGDIDGNIGVTLVDAILALQAISGLSPTGIPVNCANSGADVNGDGEIGMAEVIYILQKVAVLR